MLRAFELGVESAINDVALLCFQRSLLTSIARLSEVIEKV